MPLAAQLRIAVAVHEKSGMSRHDAIRAVARAYAVRLMTVIDAINNLPLTRSR